MDKFATLKRVIKLMTNEELLETIEFCDSYYYGNRDVIERVKLEIHIRGLGK